MYMVSSRTYSVNINFSLSPPYFNIHGVPRCSALGPILFIIYILPIKSIFHKYHNINYHIYADDLQIYPFSSSSDSGMIQISMFNCITDLTYWFSHNSISLNMTKTNRINLLSYSQNTVNCGEFSSINHSSFYIISSNFSIYDYPMFHYNLSTRLISTH